MTRIALVGRGAIGSVIAYQCERLSYDYHVLLRQPDNTPFSVTDLQETTHNIAPASAQINQPNPFDMLILPLKAYQIGPALDELRVHITAEQVIVLLHNGMGTIQDVLARFPNNPVIAATSSYGALKDNHNNVKITGLGETHLGWLNCPDTKQKAHIEQLLSAILPPSYWHADITFSLWKKLAINACINPLTAIYDCKNGELNNKQYQQQIVQVCSEIQAIMQAEGYAITTSKLQQLVMQVITATAANFSSMHQDLLYHRPTEIDFINGYVVKVAQRCGISTPTNTKLFKQVKALQGSE